MIRVAAATLQRGATNTASISRLVSSGLETNQRLRIVGCLQRQLLHAPRSFSTSDDWYDGQEEQQNAAAATNSKFAVVKHADAYKTAMRGLHGQQLALAQVEGEGKDEPDFDPFLEEELEEARLIAEREGYLADPKSPVEDDEDDDDDDDDDEEDDEFEDIAEDDSSSPDVQKVNRKLYKNDGSLKRNKSELAILRAGAPAGGMVAIIALAGTQHKVTTDDVLIVNRLKPVSEFAVGSIQTLTGDQVLLVTTSALTLVGMPFVPGAEVDVLVEEITRDAKVIIFKKRRRKNSKRKTGFRRDITMLRVLDIRFPAPYQDHVHVKRPDPSPMVYNGNKALAYDGK